MSCWFRRRAVLLLPRVGRTVRWCSRTGLCWLPTISREFRATPPQSAFLRSTAKIRGYGGAMGGGKSRAICEAALQYAIDYPGLRVLIARQSHTSIVETTKKTMLAEVLPGELLGLCRRKASMGEDFIELPNGSVFHFVGLDDPVRWYSAEIGLFIVDQVEECTEDTIVRLITRLRQRDAPLKVILSFNPENPGHWLQKWFILGAERTKWGFRKRELYATDATRPLGSAEVFFAKATDNPYLPDGYVDDTLAGLPAHLRRRYLEGLWEFISGSCFFNTEALGHYEQLSRTVLPKLNGTTAGDAHADMLTRVGRGPVPKDKIRFKRGEGPLAIWQSPVREHEDQNGRSQPPHRYVIGVDVASGKSFDYTAMQVVCVETFEQVARFQGKLDPDQAAVEAYRLGRIYNDALIVPEITGGWGFSLEQELKRLRYPKIYTRRVLDRLTKRWTDKTGWDTTVRMRAHMLDTLERVLREKELGLYDLATINELGTFVMNDNGKPEAQPGCNDDLVTSLAVAVTVAVDQPRQLRRIREKPHQPQIAVTGY